MQADSATTTLKSGTDIVRLLGQCSTLYALRLAAAGTIIELKHNHQDDFRQ